MNHILDNNKNADANVFTCVLQNTNSYTYKNNCDSCGQSEFATAQA